METVRVGRNDLCPCGSGRKFKRCCQNQSAGGGTGGITAFEKARPVFGDGAETGRHSPQPALRQHEDVGQPLERIPIHYTYAEPFGEAECVYCFPVDQPIILDNGSVVPARWLQAGMLFRMEDGSLGTVTAVEPPKVWEPPSRVPDRHGNYARRVLGTIKHRGYIVLDVTFGGTTVTTTPDHRFYSASREAWVPVGSMRPGESLRNAQGAVTTVESIGSPRHGFIELYNLEVEEFHTFFVGSGGAGSALVHNGEGDCIKKPLELVPNPIFRGGTSLKPRLGVDVKAAADGLIHPLGRNGKPQGLSLNIDPNNKFIQQYGGAFPVASVPDGLQILQSGHPGHYVVAPKVPMTFEAYEALCEKLVLGLSNRIPR